jgi:hypothetical protein
MFFFKRPEFLNEREDVMKDVLEILGDYNADEEDWGERRTRMMVDLAKLAFSEEQCAQIYEWKFPEVN